MVKGKAGQERGMREWREGDRGCDFALKYRNRNNLEIEEREKLRLKCEKKVLQRKAKWQRGKERA